MLRQQYKLLILAHQINFKTIPPANSIALFVKSIMLFEEGKKQQQTVLPFYADGYPGIMFQVTGNGLYVVPQNKKMPNFFLYGQTIHPIQLKIEGAYKLIVFQLYPFVINSFFSVNPKVLNDDCFDLNRLKGFNVEKLINQLSKTNDLKNWNNIITAFLYALFQAKKEQLDFTIQQAIQLIVQHSGQQTIKQLRKNLNITERTFERRFSAQVGITPKQFSKIIQFQLSLTAITGKAYAKLTDVVYKNGFADQSHFIRVFKAFTGKTPKKFNPTLQ
jgi:AraC-like DNA-binding protein